MSGVGANFIDSHLAGMALIVKQNEGSNVLNIRLFGFEAVMLGSQSLAVWRSGGLDPVAEVV
jgi:hypothetical protein